MTIKRVGRLIAALGALIFALGWSFGIYFAIDPGNKFQLTLLGPVQNRMANLLWFGVPATTAAGVLWAVAAYLLTRPPHSS